MEVHVIMNQKKHTMVLKYGEKRASNHKSKEEVL